MLGLILTVLLGAAQASLSAPASQRLVEASLREGRAFEALTELCHVAPHRLAGSAGLTRAEDWAVAWLRDRGLENVRKEPVRVPRWVRGPARLAVASPASAQGTYLPLLALGGSVATPPAGLRAPLVIVTSFEELRGLGERARGTIVLFNRPMDPTLADPFAAYGAAVEQRSRGAVEAARAGAVAALVRSMTLALDDHPHTGALRYEPDVPRIPAAAISTRAAARLVEAARGGARLELELQLECRDEGEVEAHNVIAEITGRERPGEIVVVGGHLDAWDVGQGAHDDGAGCVQAMETLRLVHSLGLRPRRTLRCVLWTNEENGLRGAVAYKDAHESELAGHVLAIESDRGGFAPRGFETNATGAAFQTLEGIVRQLAPYGAAFLRPGSGGADTGPLERAGTNVMQFVPDAARYFDYHHCGRDTLDAVHPRELALSAGVIAALAWSVAELELPLARPELPAAGSR